MRASLAGKIEKAKQDRSDRLSKEEEMQEALSHLQYYKSQSRAIDSAIKRLKEDYILCRKNAKLWQARIDKLEAKQ